MTFEAALLRADHVGIRELREHLSDQLKRKQPLIVTERGVPKKVILSYQDVLDLIEALHELQDQELVALVREGRAAVRRGAKGIPVKRLFQKIRSRR